MIYLDKTSISQYSMKEELELLCILNYSYFTQDLLLRRGGEVSYITHNKGRN